jgi:hypothetical protein
VQSIFSFSKAKTTEMDFTPSVFLKKSYFLSPSRGDDIFITADFNRRVQIIGRRFVSERRYIKVMSLRDKDDDFVLFAAD